jgi:hypothetical protein
MTKTVDSGSPKTVSELTHVQRWEDDGGTVSEGGNPIAHAAETNTPLSMGVAKNDLLYVQPNTNHLEGDKQVNPFVLFLASSTGRIVRILGGLALIVWGRFGLSGMTALVVALIGVVPLFAGTFDFCVFAPLFGDPLSGSKIRAGNS